MQEYRGQYLQVFSALRAYEDDFFLLGRETSTQLVKEIHKTPVSRDPFLPRLAIVLFTQTDGDPGEIADEPPPPLKQLCVGLNEGLGHWGEREEGMPLIGCSVASIPDPKNHRLVKKGFSLTLLVTRPRDLTVRVGGSAGFIDKEDGHERAWSKCLREIDEQYLASSAADGTISDDGFVLAFFPGLIEGATDFKTRTRASYRFLRGKINADLPIYGAGAGEFSDAQRQCQVMAGPDLIANGYACAKVQTTLRFKMSMDHSLKTAPDVLIIKELKEGDRGRSIVSFAVPPNYETVPARDVLAGLRDKYKVQRFAFRAIELGEKREDLSFISVNPGDESLKLLGPVQENTLIRPAFADLSEPLFSQQITKRLPEDVPIAVIFSLTCHGWFLMMGAQEAEREATVLQVMENTQAPNCLVIPGFVFGEWGVGPDMNGQAQHYHSTRLVIADELTPRHHQRRQLEVIDQCSRNMYAALLRTEGSSGQRLTVREAAAVLTDPLFEAIVDLGYEGGMISLVNETDQTLVGAEAYGDVWQKLKKVTVVRLDEPDVLAQVYRDSFQEQMHRHIADSRREPACRREAAAGIVTQTVLPLWDGNLCLGTLQVGHPVPHNLLPNHERNALSAIARTAALHLGRVKVQYTIRDLDEAVRYAVSCEDQEKGWCHLARVAAQAVEVPFCLIRVLDRTGSFLKLVGGSQELLDLTRRHGRSYTSIGEGQGPVVQWFRRFSSQGRQMEPSTEVHVVPDTTRDRGLIAISGSVGELANFYQRILSYALGALISPQQGLVGVISFLSFRPEFFTPERTELVRKIAADASIVASVYKSVTREQLMLETTLSLTNIQTQVDHILRVSDDSKANFKAAAELLVTEAVKILPCEACTLHRIEEGHYLRLQAAAPDETIHNKREWDILNPKDYGFLLYLATQKGVYRASGQKLRENPRILVKTGVWSWLPKTNKLHSILAIPLVAPDGLHYGLLTLYNRLNEEGNPADSVDFTDVPTRVRSFLQEIATNVLEVLESRSRFALLAGLSEEFQTHLDSYANSPLISDRVFCHLAASLAKWLDAQICSIFLIRHPEKNLVLRGCYGWVSGDQMLYRASYEVGEGLTGRLAQLPEPVIISNVFADLRHTGKYFSEMYGPPDPDRTYEMITLPLRARQGDEPLGIITVHRKLPREFAHLLGFSERNGLALKLASHLARMAVVAIEEGPQTEEALEHERPAIAEILSVAANERLRALNHTQLAERIAEYFKARLCGIFLTLNQDPNFVNLSGANGDLRRFVDKIRIEKYDGPVGEAFGSRVTQSRDLPEQLSYTGLDQTLRACLKEPMLNLMAAPMNLGEECGGVILLVNRPSTSQGEQRERSLRKYHLEALGTGILLVRRDIEFAAHLHAYQEAMAEQLKATELASAAQTLAHAARNRLNTIASCLTVVRNPKASSALREERFRWIESTYEDFAKNVEELLEPVRRASTAELVDLANVVQKAVELNNAAAVERQIEIVNEVKVETWVKGRWIQIMGAVSAILENAVEACERTTGRICVTLVRSPENQMIGISVVDNGVGISAKNLRRVFAEGFSTKDRANGRKRGYGLHTARIALIFHEGEIEIEGPPGGGTRVTAWLPGDI